MCRQKFVEPRQFGGRCLHDVNSGAAVHVDIDEARRQDGIWEIASEINHGCVLGNFLLRPRGDARDAAILDKQERVQYLFPRREKTMSAENNHS
jgi:hypothetical protein